MANKFRIVGYRDLRPVDWLSGKRMPLDPGEGHTCDRCGATTPLTVVLSKLYPVSMHLSLPDGWTCSTMADSGVLHTVCPKCSAPKFAAEPVTRPATPGAKRKSKL